MLTEKIYQTLLSEIKEKTDIIKENLYENYEMACTRFQDNDFRVYIQVDEDGKITKIFHGEYKPDVPKNLNRNDTICIASLKNMADRCDMLFFQKQQQIEEELTKEYNEKLNELDAEDEIGIANLKEEYGNIYDTSVFLGGSFTSEELKATYDIESAFSDLYQYLDNVFNNME